MLVRQVLIGEPLGTWTFMVKEHQHQIFLDNRPSFGFRKSSGFQVQVMSLSFDSFLADETGWEWGETLVLCTARGQSSLCGVLAT